MCSDCYISRNKELLTMVGKFEYKERFFENKGANAGGNLCILFKPILLARLYGSFLKIRRKKPG